MRITVPFIYAARLVKRGHQVERPYAVLGRETFEIPEIEAAEAPLAARLRFSPPQHAGQEFGPQAMDYRVLPGGAADPGQVPGGDVLARPLALHLGHLHRRPDWKPVEAAEAQKVLDAWERQLFRSALSARTGRPFDPGVFSSSLVADPNSSILVDAGVEDEAALQVRRHAWSDRGERLERLRATIARCAVVEGTVFAPSAAPCWRVAAQRVYDRQHNPRDLVLVAACAEAQRGESESCRFLPATRLDEARRLAERMRARAAADPARPLGLPPEMAQRPEVLVRGGIDVFMPALIEREHAAGRMLRAAEAMAQAALPDLARLTPEGLRAFADLKEACLAAVHPGDPALPQRALEAALAVDRHWTPLDDARAAEGARHPLAGFRPQAAPAAPAARARDREAEGAVAITAEDLAGFARAPGR